MAKKNRRQRQNVNAGKNANNSNRTRKEADKGGSIDDEAVLIRAGDGEVEKETPVVNGGHKALAVAAPKGLANLGNTCFFNSVLQNLCRTSSLIHALQKTKRQTFLRINTEDVDSMDVNLTPQFKLTDALLNFLVTMNHGDPVIDVRAGGKARRPARTRTESPKLLFNQICAISSRFRGYQQQDSQELLHALLDGIKDEEIKRRKQAILTKLNLLGKRAKEVNPALRERVKKYGQAAVNMPTVVDMLFSGTLVSSVLCDECGKITQVTEEFIDISLPIVDVAPSHHPQHNAPAKRYQKSQESGQNGTVESSPAPLSKHGKKKLKKQAKRNRRQQKSHTQENDDDIENGDEALKAADSLQDDIVVKMEKLNLADLENAAGDSELKNAAEKQDDRSPDLSCGDRISTSDNSREIEKLAASIVQNVLEKSLQTVSPEMQPETKAGPGEDVASAVGTATADCGVATNEGSNLENENAVDSKNVLESEDKLNGSGTAWHGTDAAVIDATGADADLSDCGRTCGGAIPEDSMTHPPVQLCNGAMANGGLDIEAHLNQTNRLTMDGTSQGEETTDALPIVPIPGNTHTEDLANGQKHSLTSTHVVNPTSTVNEASCITASTTERLVESNGSDKSMTNTARSTASNATNATTASSVTNGPHVSIPPEESSNETSCGSSVTTATSVPSVTNGPPVSNVPHTNSSVTTVSHEDVVLNGGSVQGDGDSDGVPCDTIDPPVPCVPKLPLAVGENGLSENEESDTSEALPDNTGPSQASDRPIMDESAARANGEIELRDATLQKPEEAEMSSASERTEPSSGNDEKEASPGEDLENNGDAPSLFETPARQPGRCFTTYCSKLPTSISQRYEPKHQECSIQSCLHKFTMAEMLTGNNKFGCDECTKRQCKGEAKPKTVYCNASKQMLIKTPPLILTLHLKRFQQSGRGLRKFSRNVTIPVEFDLSPFCSTDAENHLDSKEQLRYRVFGLVEHCGSMSRGHYTSYVNVRPENADILKQLDDRFENPDAAFSISSTGTGNEDDATTGTWYHISDTHVSKSTEERALNCNAYLVFYERIF